MSYWNRTRFNKASTSTEQSQSTISVCLQSHAGEENNLQQLNSRFVRCEIEVVLKLIIEILA